MIDGVKLRHKDYAACSPLFGKPDFPESERGFYAALGNLNLCLAICLRE